MCARPVRTGHRLRRGELLFGGVLDGDGVVGARKGAGRRRGQFLVCRFCVCGGGGGSVVVVAGLAASSRDGVEPGGNPGRYRGPEPGRNCGCPGGGGEASEDAGRGGPPRSAAEDPPYWERHGGWIELWSPVVWVSDEVQNREMIMPRL
jgi:hypothetical protein